MNTYKYYVFEKGTPILFHEESFNDANQAIDFLKCPSMQIVHIGAMEELKDNKVVRVFSRNNHSKMTIIWERE